MKIGLYKDKGGGEQNVIEVDEVGNRVLVDYGNDKKVWYGEEDYSTWTLEESANTEWVTATELEELFEKDKNIQEMLQDEPPTVFVKPEKKKSGRKKKIE